MVEREREREMRTWDLPALQNPSGLYRLEYGILVLPWVFSQYWNRHTAGDLLQFSFTERFCRKKKKKRKKRPG